MGLQSVEKHGKSSPSTLQLHCICAIHKQQRLIVEQEILFGLRQSCLAHCNTDNCSPAQVFLTFHVMCTLHVHCHNHMEMFCLVLIEWALLNCCWLKGRDWTCVDLTVCKNKQLLYMDLLFFLKFVEDLVCSNVITVYIWFSIWQEVVWKKGNWINWCWLHTFWIKSSSLCLIWLT